MRDEVPHVLPVRGAHPLQVETPRKRRRSRPGQHRATRSVRGEREVRVLEVESRRRLDTVTGPEDLAGAANALREQVQPALPRVLPRDHGPVRVAVRRDLRLYLWKRRRADGHSIDLPARGDGSVGHHALDVNVIVGRGRVSAVGPAYVETVA